MTRISSNPLGSADVLLLDTHVWVWILNGDLRARRSPALRIVEDAAANGSVRLSWVSIWEVSMLESRGRIVFPVPLREWIQKALDAPGISLAALEPDILIESTRLPGEFHSDPMDHILVATARRYNARLVTSDPRILRYAKRDFVKALAF